MIVTGNLKDFSLSDIIKMSCIDIQTCQIVIKTNTGEGIIYFSDGLPVHAQHAGTSGVDAIYNLLNETEKNGGVFRVEPDVVLPKRTVTLSWEQVLEKRTVDPQAASVSEPVPRKSKNKALYIEQREAITKVLQNFQAQSSAKRSGGALSKTVPFSNTEPQRRSEPMPEIRQPEYSDPASISDAPSIPSPGKPSGRGGQLSKILQTLVMREPNIIEGVALVSTEGFIIASSLPVELEEEHVAAISAVVLSLGERITNELKRGKLEQVYVRGTMGYVFLTQAGPDALLAVITSSEAKLGMVFLDTKRAINELSELI